jgi:2-C-methyl-D-erythritol 4-phosphate cytidylyltransferase/2-C-methyl-D-erythritol 2,4-cyclodiphosphate synthase
MDHLALVIPTEAEHHFRQRLPASLADRCLLVPGGEERANSVLAGVTALLGAGVAPSTMALVHDAARPAVTSELALAVATAARGAGAALPVIPVGDTLWRVRDGRGVAIVDRTGVVAAQTPQAAPLETLRDAIIDALGRDEAPTDEAAALLAHGVAVVTVPGDPANRKLTTPGDEALVRDALRARLLGPIATGVEVERAGIGFDAHRLVAGRPMRLAGLDWPAEPRGPAGHSDGDVALHAVVDAVLGAAHAGDIGTQFPPDDEAWRDADSADLLGRAVAIARETGIMPRSADVAIAGARPSIVTRREEAEARIAALLGVAAGAVSVRGTTTDGLGFPGEEGIAAWAVVGVEPTR